MKIITEQHFDFPLSHRLSFNNWSAWDEDSYDGADDSTAPMGYGATEAEAIIDLREQLDEKEGDCDDDKEAV